MENTAEGNIVHNKSFYNEKYKDLNIDSIINILDRLDDHLDKITKTEISWVGMYYGDFKEMIKGKTVLELGCGDCKNVAIMAALGAKVYANDISDRSGDIIELLNNSYNFQHPIEFLKGDYVQNHLEDSVFDIIIGKAFLHHLTLEHEEQMVSEIYRTLKPGGHARFFEPAVNSKVLDELRWAVPVPGRPSKWFQPKKFKEWEEADPHPHRDNSSEHFKKLGETYFDQVEIIPLGIIERFDRILPFGKNKSRDFKQWSLKAERSLPKGLRKFGARSQLVMYNKKQDVD